LLDLLDIYPHYSFLMVAGFKPQTLHILFSIFLIQEIERQTWHSSTNERGWHIQWKQIYEQINSFFWSNAN